MQEQRQSSTQVQLVKRAMKPAQGKAIPTRNDLLWRKSDVLVCGPAVSSLMCHVMFADDNGPFAFQPVSRCIARGEKKFSRTAASCLPRTRFYNRMTHEVLRRGSDQHDNI